jgi:tetratricopeptide (TPR) repeat protein
VEEVFYDKNDITARRTNMKTYAEIVADADAARHANDWPSAIPLYKKALDIAGKNDRHCQQMLGVCYSMGDQHDEALEWLEKALEGASVIERGHILRDQGKALYKLGRHMEAEKHFQESLRLLPIYEDPAGTGATLGFYASLRMDQGRLAEGLRQFMVADAILQASGNRQAELYVALWYAFALIQAGKPDRAKAVAKRALDLAKEYGGKDHVARAQLYLDHADDPKLVANKVRGKDRQKNRPD